MQQILWKTQYNTGTPGWVGWAITHPTFSSLSIVLCNSSFHSLFSVCHPILSCFRGPCNIVNTDIPCFFYPIESHCAMNASNGSGSKQQQKYTNTRKVSRVTCAKRHYIVELLILLSFQQSETKKFIIRIQQYNLH